MYNVTVVGVSYRFDELRESHLAFGDVVWFPTHISRLTVRYTRIWLLKKTRLDYIQFRE